LANKKFPYQSIDSGKFYNKINSRLSTNSNVSFYKNLNEINSENSIIFNSVFEKQLDKSNLWQHFQGIEIETPMKIFDEEIINLMDFNCDQKIIKSIGKKKPYYIDSWSLEYFKYFFIYHLKT